MRTESVVRPAPQLQVETISDSGPVACCALHPTDTLALYATSGSVIVCYDFASHRTLLRKSLKEIVAANVERSPPTVLTPSVFGPPDPLGPKLPKHCRTHSEKPIETRKISLLPSSAVLNVGSVKAVQFSGYSSLQSLWIGKKAKRSILNTIHSDSLVTIICEMGVIFYDMNKNLTRSISYHDLDKTSPSSVEFIHFELCAVGCSDGCIRIFDTTALKCKRVLNSHCKNTKSNDVCIIKCIPDEVTDHLSSYLLRFLSMSHDSIGYVWYGVVSGEDVDIGEPTAVIKNPKKDTMLAGSSSFPVSVTFDAAALSLYVVYSNHKTRFD